MAGCLVLASAPVRAGEPLEPGVVAGIHEALEDERHSEALYARVLGDHGDVRPFAPIVRAERRHAELLEGLLLSRGATVPPNAWAGAPVPGHASVAEACAAALEAEARNIALYDRLLVSGPLPDDVKRAFEHNRMASADHHRPAFERCGGRGGRGAGARGAGRGCGRRGGAADAGL